MSEPLQEVIYEAYPAWKTRKMKAGHRCLNKKKISMVYFLEFMCADGQRKKQKLNSWCRMENVADHTWFSKLSIVITSGTRKICLNNCLLHVHFTLSI